MLRHRGAAAEGWLPFLDGDAGVGVAPLRVGLEPPRLTRLRTYEGAGGATVFETSTARYPSVNMWYWDREEVEEEEEGRESGKR